VAKVYQTILLKEGALGHACVITNQSNYKNIHE